jgi:hypothetical protein
MTTELPHDPYIRAVVIALTTAGLEPEGWWTSDAETDPYRTDDDAGVATMLNAILLWSGDHAAVADAVAPDGMLLLWDHPAEQWQYAERRPGGGNEEPRFLPTLGLWSDPDAVVAAVRALLAGEPLPEGHAPYWHPADSVRRAVAAWEIDESCA